MTLTPPKLNDCSVPVVRMDKTGAVILSTESDCELLRKFMAENGISNAAIDAHKEMTLTNEQYVRLELVKTFQSKAESMQPQNFAQFMDRMVLNILGNTPVPLAELVARIQELERWQKTNESMYDKLSNRWQKATGMTLEQAEERSTWNKLKEELPPEKVMAMEKIHFKGFKVGDWVRLKNDDSPQMKVYAVSGIDKKLIFCKGDGFEKSYHADALELAPGFTS